MRELEKKLNPHNYGFKHGIAVPSELRINDSVHRVVPIVFQAARQTIPFWQRLHRRHVMQGVIDEMR